MKIQFKSRLFNPVLVGEKKDEWILDLNQSDPANEKLFIGKRMNVAVLYPSFPGIDSTNTPATKIDMAKILNPDGIQFVDNWPSNDDDQRHCAV